MTKVSTGAKNVIYILGSSRWFVHAQTYEDSASNCASNKCIEVSNVKSQMVE